MDSCVYTSSAVNKFSPADLEQLLTQSRIKNKANGITGLLLYRDGNFVQAIEGPSAAVSALLERIHRDSRHHGITILLKEQIDGPRFAEWSMALRQPTDSQLANLPGYNDLLRGTESDWRAFAADGAKSKRLLATLAARLL